MLNYFDWNEENTTTESGEEFESVTKEGSDSPSTFCDLDKNDEIENLKEKIFHMENEKDLMKNFINTLIEERTLILNEASTFYQVSWLIMLAGYTTIPLLSAPYMIVFSYVSMATLLSFTNMSIVSNSGFNGKTSFDLKNFFSSIGEKIKMA